MQLREAAIKRVIVRSGAKMARYNIVYTKDHYYWPQETIRHCRTGRIKRGMVLKRQFGIYYPEKGHDLIALKIMEKTAISESFQWDEDDVQTELGVMKELSMHGGHENVLYMYDALETKEYLIAVMELVDGDLHDMLGSVQGHVAVVDVFHQILLGYQYIVKQGYYHCDLSLENVLVKLVPNYCKTGKARLIVKLSDFGRVRKMDADGSAVIEFDEIAGKPYYLAPEAYSDSYEAGPADIWSLGIILFILITGNPPFGIANDSDEVFEPFSSVGFEYLIPALQRHNATEEEIELLSKLLAIDPDKRPTLDSVLQLTWLSV